MTGELYGDGGLDCLAEVPLWQRHLECAVSVPVYAFLAFKGLRMIKTSVDEGSAATSQSAHLQSDAWLAVTLAFVLGWEFVYKLQVGSLIYFINPCHLITAIQICILCSPVSRRSLTLYYLSVNLMFGPLTAVLLPVLNTRVIRGEQAVYWIQHALILFIVPAYLAASKFPLYRFKHQMSWFIFSHGSYGVYMMGFLSFLGEFTLVNLNSTLCAAVSDPFRGPFFRMHAMWHQLLSMLVVGIASWAYAKVFSTLSLWSCRGFSSKAENKAAAGKEKQKLK